MSVPQVNLSFPNGSKSSFSGGLFINNEFVAGAEGKTFSVVNPATGKEIAQVAEATAKDVDIAVQVARKAYKNVWGQKVPGYERGKLLQKLAALVEEHADELASIESLDNGKPFSFARGFDVAEVANVLRYYAGWADKNTGQVIEVDNTKLHYTREEPIGVCGQVIPWNFPILMLSWKWAPALATGNTIVMKTAEQTPLSALRMAELAKQAGFPAGVINVLSGFGPTAGAAIANHMDIDKIAFTGSTLVGRNIMKAAASTNLKKVTLELGGKSPNIILEDADLDKAVSWAAFGVFFNTGQCCCAGTRVYVHDKIYDQFMQKLMAKIDSIKTGDAFDADTFQGPVVSQLQFDRVMAYIESGKKDGAKLAVGGARHGDQGYFIQPTVFTDVPRDAKINREEVFGSVLVCHRFKDHQELLELANDSVYGLAAAVFSENISHALETAHALQAGTVWVNCYNQLTTQVPFGGYKTSGIGRELGQYALANYTQVKAVHVNLSAPAPI